MVFELSLERGGRVVFDRGRGRNLVGRGWDGIGGLLQAGLGSEGSGLETERVQHARGWCVCVCVCAQVCVEGGREERMRRETWTWAWNPRRTGTLGLARLP